MYKRQERERERENLHRTLDEKADAVCFPSIQHSAFAGVGISFLDELNYTRGHNVCVFSLAHQGRKSLH